ncbi:MAG TPA: GerMN domain-containing protein [Acidimicrobiales bacterium]|nr:GerMN domain-containing protein [Acidimicrobiales bacterium]
MIGVAALLGVACSSGGIDDAGPAPSQATTSAAPAGTEAPVPPGDTAAPASPGPSTASATTETMIYLLKGETLVKASRRVPRVAAIGREAVEALLAGPTRTEAGAGLGTAIPQGTRLGGLVIEGGTATVDLSRTFESGGGTLGMTLRLAQVTCTLDQFDSVTGVRFALAGKLISVFSGEGIVLDRPVTCSSYGEYLGVSPKPGEPAPSVRSCPNPPDESCPRPANGPQLTASPTAAEPGQEIEVSVSRFRPGTDVVVDLRGQQSNDIFDLFVLRTDGAGVGRQRFLVPGQVPPGDYVLIATSEDRKETASARVVIQRSSACAPDQQPTC